MLAKPGDLKSHLTTQTTTFISFSHEYCLKENFGPKMERYGYYLTLWFNRLDIYLIELLDLFKLTTPFNQYTVNFYLFLQNPLEVQANQSLFSFRGVQT